MNRDPIELALEVARILDACEVAYLVGGSLSSSIYGEPRSTLDIDMVVALTEPLIDPLVSALGDEFYADAEAIRRAVRENSSVNLIHLKSSIKVDLFIQGGTPLDAEQLSRRVRIKVRENPDRYLFSYTAEDILLQKLRWFRLGNEVSDRQWRDILGILKRQSGVLDLPYLGKRAGIIRVSDLLEKAIQEAKL